MAFDPIKEIDLDEAHKIIRGIIESGDLRYGSHLRQRMAERNFTMTDVKYILQEGKLTKKEYNKDLKHWKYSIKGKDVDGVAGTTITAIIDTNTLFLITVY
jgi:hypothetical protein